MISIGERLRRQRLQNRIGLDRVSEETKIGVRLLEAIEAEQFEKLPGGVFRRSFVLQYARALGLDPEEIASDLKQLNQFDEPPALPTAEMIPNRDFSISRFSLPIDLTAIEGSTIGSLLAAVGVMMACALIYSWWSTPRHPSPAPKKEIARVAPAQPAVTPIAADLPSVEPAKSAPVQVGLSADEKTWISISSDGKRVFADALQAHETKLIEASEKVLLRIGNAGGLEIRLNGKPIGPVGPRGQVRVIELTPEGFQIVPPKSPT